MAEFENLAILKFDWQKWKPISFLPSLLNILIVDERWHNKMDIVLNLVTFMEAHVRIKTFYSKIDFHGDYHNGILKVD